MQISNGYSAVSKLEPTILCLSSIKYLGNRYDDTGTGTEIRRVNGQGHNCFVITSHCTIMVLIYRGY